jgi:SAM-dependent methyltransferase
MAEAAEYDEGGQVSERSMEQIRRHYLVEKELASRLKAASKEQRRELYKVVYDELYSRVPDHPGLARKKSPEEIQRRVASQMKLAARYLKPGQTFVEFGAGDCQFAFAVARQGLQAYAVEVSDKKTDMNDVPANFHLVIDRGDHPSLPDDSVDIAYSHMFLEHLHPEDALDHLQGVRKMLKPGGIYICVTPQKLVGPTDISGYFDSESTCLHLKEYTASELYQLFRRADYTKVEILLPFRGKWVSANPLFIWLFELPFRLMPYTIRKPLALRFLFENLRFAAYK